MTGGRASLPIRAGSAVAVLLAGFATAASAKPRADWLPRIRPTACTTHFCFHYSGPYAMAETVITRDPSRKVDTAVLRLEDGTVVAFAGPFPTSACVSSDPRWVQGDPRSFKGSLCVSRGDGGEAVTIGVAIRSTLALVAKRHAIESETCVWPFVLGKPISLGDASCIPSI